MTPAPRIALVLGAGGVAGHAFHAGVLRAIAEETGWDPRDAALIVGTSAGSVVGLGLRAGLPALDLYARTVDEDVTSEGARLLSHLPPPDDEPWWLQASARRSLLPASPQLVARLATRPWHARPGVVLAGLLPAGTLDVSRIASDADALVAAAAAPIRDLWLSAVRLRDGRRVLFGREDTHQPSGPWGWGQAVAASCAIPTFFEPVTIAGERYVDGGAHSPTSAHVAAAIEPDLVVVSSPMSAVRNAGRRSLDAPVRTMYRFRLGAEVARLRRRGIPVAVFQPTAEVIRAAGINAMNPEARIPVARASYVAAAERCRRDDFTPHAAVLAA